MPERILDYAPPVSRRFTGWVVAWTAIGLAVRVGYVLIAARDRALGGDPQYFYGLAQMLRHGRGWNDPFLYGYGLGIHPTATHPPLYPIVLMIGSFLGFGSELGSKLFSCAIGTTAIPVVAVAGRRYAGVRTGVIAAAFTAISPFLWINDASLLSESLLAVLIAIVLLRAEATAREPTTRQGVWLGVAIGLAALTHAELVLLVPLLAWPSLAAAQVRSAYGSSVRVRRPPRRCWSSRRGSASISRGSTIRF